MNDAPTPTTPADPNPSSDNRRRRAGAPASSDPSAEGQQQPARAQDGDSSTTGPNSARAPAQRPSLSQKAKEGLSQKLRFLNHLVYTLDTLVHAELCVLYYMEYAPFLPPQYTTTPVLQVGWLTAIFFPPSCSFFRLAIRWVAQSLFISPRSEESFLSVPNYHVSAIIAPNIICILLHLVTSLPFAGEASRGYLHGGVLIDFIGQKAPTSRLSLLLLDFLIFGIQCLMVAVNMEKDRIRKVVKPPRVLSATTTTTDAAAEAPVTTQDHDAEERGVLRDAPVLDETEDIEMRPLGADPQDSDERANLLERGPAEASSDYDGLLDVLRSGNATLSTFHVRQALRATWNNRGNTPESAAAYAIQNVGYNATLAALAAQRRARLAAAAHQR